MDWDGAAEAEAKDIVAKDLLLQAALLGVKAFLSGKNEADVPFIGDLIATAAWLEGYRVALRAFPLQEK